MSDQKLTQEAVVGVSTPEEQPKCQFQHDPGVKCRGSDRFQVGTDEDFTISMVCCSLGVQTASGRLRKRRVTPFVRLVWPK